MNINSSALVAAADVYEAQTGEVDELALGSAIETYLLELLEAQAREEAKQRIFDREREEDEHGKWERLQEKL